jgi:hypothetical protein
VIPSSSEQQKDLDSNITTCQLLQYVVVLQFLLQTTNPGEDSKKGGEKSSPFFIDIRYRKIYLEHLEVRTNAIVSFSSNKKTKLDDSS